VPIRRKKFSDTPKSDAAATMPRGIGADLYEDATGSMRSSRAHNKEAEDVVRSLQVFMQWVCGACATIALAMLLMASDDDRVPLYVMLICSLLPLPYLYNECHSRDPRLRKKILRATTAVPMGALGYLLGAVVAPIEYGARRRAPTARSLHARVGVR
jgi:hypothetical protein